MRVEFEVVSFLIPSEWSNQKF